LLLQLAAPPSYDPATLTDVTVLVAASLLPYVLYLSHVHIVFFHRRTGVLALATPVAAAVNVALNVVLIPRWGLGGAALASLLGYGLLAALVAVVARRIQVVPWDLRRWLLAGVVGVVVVAAALALPASGAVAVTIRAGATVAAAAALLVVARRLLREERALVAAEAG